MLQTPDKKLSPQGEPLQIVTQLRTLAWTGMIARMLAIPVEVAYKRLERLSGQGYIEQTLYPFGGPVQRQHVGWRLTKKGRVEARWLPDLEWMAPRLTNWDGRPAEHIRKAVPA